MTSHPLTSEESASGRHTRGPWRVVVHGDDAYILDSGDAPRGITSIQLKDTGISREEALANAARIVQCVNAHDEMVEVLTRILEAEFDSGCSGGWPTEAQVRAVLAKALGGAA